MFVFDQNDLCISFPLSSVNPRCLWLLMLTLSFLINIRNILTTDRTSPPGNNKIKTSSSINQQETSQNRKYLALQETIDAVDMICRGFSLQPWVCVPDKTRHPPSRSSLFCRILMVASECCFPAFYHTGGDSDLQGPLAG